MQNTMRLAAFSLVLALTLACGAPAEQASAPQGKRSRHSRGSAPGDTTATPASANTGAPGATPARTPGTAAPAAAPAAPAGTNDDADGCAIGHRLSPDSRNAGVIGNVEARTGGSCAGGEAGHDTGMTAIPEGAPVTGRVVRRSDRAASKGARRSRFVSIE